MEKLNGTIQKSVFTVSVSFRIKTSENISKSSLQVSKWSVQSKGHEEPGTFFYFLFTSHNVHLYFFFGPETDCPSEESVVQKKKKRLWNQWTTIEIFTCLVHFQGWQMRRWEISLTGIQHQTPVEVKWNEENERLHFTVSEEKNRGTEGDEPQGK